MDLSVVVISRNEERSIAASIESLLEQTADFETEVILVDSASTDRTVEIAGRYPITIVRIEPGADLSASAGRYLGTLRASGKYILFVDGDMILIHDWIRNALSFFDDDTVGAVGGRLFRVYPGESLSFDHPDTYPLGQVDRLGGAGLYRRDVLEKTGSFNPFVKGEEERELGYRINTAGYKILRVDVPMVYHMERARTRSARDENARHFTGVGQNIRRYGFRKISWELLWSHRAAFRAHVAFFAASVILLLLLVSGQTLAFGVGAALLVAVLVGVMLVMGWEKSYLFFRYSFLVFANLLKGMRLGIPAPDKYKVQTSVLSRVGRT